MFFIEIFSFFQTIFSYAEIFLIYSNKHCVYCRQPFNTNLLCYFIASTHIIAKFMSKLLSWDAISLDAYENIRSRSKYKNPMVT